MSYKMFVNGKLKTISPEALARAMRSGDLTFDSKKGFVPKGWHGESVRHSMASYGIKTGRNPTAKERKRNPYLSKDSVVYRKPKITPMPKGTNVWDVEDPEGAGLTEKQNNQIWQHLVDTGMAWRLQGWYGRTASAMIEAGIIKRKE